MEQGLSLWLRDRLSDENHLYQDHVAGSPDADAQQIIALPDMERSDDRHCHQLRDKRISLPEIDCFQAVDNQDSDDRRWQQQAQVSQQW